MPSGTSYGFGVDYYAMYELGNAWIRLGDELDERTRTMTQAVSGMDWTGSAAGSMRTVWGEGAADAAAAAGVTSLLIAARDNAYQIGGTIHHYAASVLKAEERAEKLALASFLGGMFGSLLTLAFPLIASIGFFGRAFVVLDQAVGRLASVITRMIPNALLGPGARAVTERGLGYLGGAVTGAATNTAVDFTIQAIAHRAVGENWKPTAVDAAFSAGFGGVFGAVGYAQFREANMAGPGFRGPQVAAVPPAGRSDAPRHDPAGGSFASAGPDGLQNAFTTRPVDLTLRQNLTPDLGTSRSTPTRDGGAPAVQADTGGTVSARNSAGGQIENPTPVSAAPVRTDAVGGEVSASPNRTDPVGGQVLATSNRTDPVGGESSATPHRADPVSGEVSATPHRADAVGGEHTVAPVRADGGEGSAPLGAAPSPPVGHAPVVDGGAPRALPEPPPTGTDPVARAGGPERFATRQDEWQSFTNERDAVYLSRLDLEERYNWATAFGPDKDLDAAQATFRNHDPDGAKLIEDNPAAVRDLNASYHRDLRQGFEASWQRTQGRPDADDGWSTELLRLRGGLPERFAHFAERQRLLDDFDGAFNRSLEQFRKDDLFGGTFLADPPESAHTLTYDEATGTHLAYRDPGPADQVRAAGRARVAAAADSAWQNAGNRRPEGEHARTMDEAIREAHADLPARLAHRSDQERQAWHAEREFDRAYDEWQDDVRTGGQIPEAASDRARQEFLGDLRRRHDGLGHELRDLPPERRGALWESTNDGLVGSVPERLEHSGFRARALDRAQHSLDDALAGHEARSSLEAGVVGEDSKERLAAAWRQDVEAAVDDHWFASREAEAGRTASGEAPGGGLLPDPPLTWEQRYANLAATLPHRIAHELEKNIVLRQAARDFHHLAGHPDDLRGQRYDVSTKQFDEIAKDFRTDTITGYDRIWGPHETDSRAWLAHEATHADTFTTALTAAQEAPLYRQAPPSHRPDDGADADGRPAAPEGTRADSPVGTPAVRPDEPPVRSDGATGTQPDPAAPESSAGRTTARDEPAGLETARSTRADERAAAGSEQVQVAPTRRAEPISQAAPPAVSRQDSGFSRDAAPAGPRPVRTEHDVPPARTDGARTYDEELFSMLPAELPGTADLTVRQLHADRLDVLGERYLEARTAAGARGPADAAEIDDLRRSVADATQRLGAESGRISDAVREFRDRHGDPGPELGESAARWYGWHFQYVEHEFSTTLAGHGRGAQAQLEQHFGAHADALRAFARTQLAAPQDAWPSSWRPAAWQAHRDDLDAVYQEAMVQAAQVHEAPAEQTGTASATEGDLQAVDAALLGGLRTRFDEALDRASASVTTLRTTGTTDASQAHATAEEHLAPEARVLAAFEVTHTDAVASAVATLRDVFDRDLLTTAAESAAATEDGAQAPASDHWDTWFDRQVEHLPMRLAVEAARTSALDQARAAGEALGRAWETALPVPSPTFVRVFDVTPGPLPADVRRTVVDAHVAEVESRFTATFADLTSVTATDALVEARLTDWQGLSRDANDRLELEVPVALAARAAAQIAEQHFRTWLAGSNRAHTLSTHQTQRLQDDFAARAQHAVTEVFAGHTGDASDLTARTWRWQQALTDLAQELPDIVVFEAMAGVSLREAGRTFQELSRAQDVDADRLEVLAADYRRDWFHGLRTLWAPPGLSETWLDQEERTDDAFTQGLAAHPVLVPDWRKSSRSIPAEDGGPVYCVEVAYLHPAPTLAHEGSR